MLVNGEQKKVSDIMREVKTISDKADFKEALEAMICERTNSLVVVNDDGEFVGMVNARTLIHKSIPSYLGDDATAAHFATQDVFKESAEKVANESILEIMDKSIKTVKANESLLKAAMIVGEGTQIRIPVLDAENKPIGLLTRTEFKEVIGFFLNIEGCFKK